MGIVAGESWGRGGGGFPALPPLLPPLPLPTAGSDPRGPAPGAAGGRGALGELGGHAQQPGPGRVRGRGRVGEEEGDSAEDAGWEGGRRPSSPGLTPGQLLEEHTERAPRISQEFGERMAHCCLGGLAEFLQRYGRRARGVGRDGRGIGVRDAGEGRVGGRRKRRSGPEGRGPAGGGGCHRLCRPKPPARDPCPTEFHLSRAHQLPTARRAIPREPRSPGAVARHLCQQDHRPGQLWAPR